MSAAVVPVDLVVRLAELLDRQHAGHLVASVATALGPYLRPDSAVGMATSRPHVEVALVARLVPLLGSTRAELLPGILTTAAPWLASTGPAATRNVELRALEVAALEHISFGRNNAAAARAMGYSEDHVKGILRATYRKLDAVDRAHATRRGFELGVLAPSDARAAAS
jgi:DNA-binding NarL/FixJ family response regulator